MKELSYKQIRAFAGYTQDELAEICDVDRRTVARFEKGQSHNHKLKTWYDETLRKITADFKEG